LSKRNIYGLLFGVCLGAVLYPQGLFMDPSTPSLSKRFLAANSDGKIMPRMIGTADLPAIAISGITGLQDALDAKAAASDLATANSAIASKASAADLSTTNANIAAMIKIRTGTAAQKGTCSATNEGEFYVTKSVSGTSGTVIQVCGRAAIGGSWLWSGVLGNL
jgi:hypothetical protein